MSPRIFDRSQHTQIPIDSLPKNVFDAAKITRIYDNFLPSGFQVKELIQNGDYGATCTIILVEKEHPEIQLGYMQLRHLTQDERWFQYMKEHKLSELWVARMDIISLIPNRGVGTTLWKISHKIIGSGNHRVVVDTSKGWTKKKITEGIMNGVFKLQEKDQMWNGLKICDRYLLQYT